jgi:hypothetical protein
MESTEKKPLGSLFETSPWWNSDIFKLFPHFYIQKRKWYSWMLLTKKEDVKGYDLSFQFLFLSIFNPSTPKNKFDFYFCDSIGFGSFSIGFGNYYIYFGALSIDLWSWCVLIFIPRLCRKK